MKKSGQSFLKKFEGAVRESWPLPPSSVFRCRAATPWINPDLFYSGIIIIGEAFPEEGENFDYVDDADIYAELEHHAVAANRLSTTIVEYSENPERGIDPGSPGTRKSTFAPVTTELHQAEKNKAGNNNRQSRVTDHNRERDIDGNVLIRFKEVPEFQDSSSSVGSSQGKKKRRWTPFKKDQSQSWSIFY